MFTASCVQSFCPSSPMSRPHLLRKAVWKQLKTLLCCATIEVACAHFSSQRRTACSHISQSLPFCDGLSGQLWDKDDVAGSVSCFRVAREVRNAECRALVTQHRFFSRSQADIRDGECSVFWACGAIRLPVEVRRRGAMPLYSRCKDNALCTRWER
jgi:hypothetical protein